MAGHHECDGRRQQQQRERGKQKKPICRAVVGCRDNSTLGRRRSRCGRARGARRPSASRAWTPPRRRPEARRGPVRTLRRGGSEKPRVEDRADDREPAGHEPGGGRRRLRHIGAGAARVGRPQAGDGAPLDLAFALDAHVQDPCDLTRAVDVAAADARAQEQGPLLPCGDRLKTATQPRYECHELLLRRLGMTGFTTCARRPAATAACGVCRPGARGARAARVAGRAVPGASVARLAGAKPCSG
jgi:hypothetical protein